MVERSWQVLKQELRRMRAMDPSPLCSYPDPESDDRRHPPFRLHLAAWAEEDAKRIHQLLGRDVRLQVGVLIFPERLDPRTRMPPAPASTDDRLRVSSTEPLKIASGHELHTRITLTNLSQDVVKLRRPHRLPSLTGLVAHPDHGGIVSGHTWPSALMGGVFTVEPGDEFELPLTVYTDSIVAELGYAVPAGRWDARAVIRNPDRTFSYSDPLPLTIV